MKRKSLDGWPYPEVHFRYEAGHRYWFETSSDVYFDQLGALPPSIQDNGFFMMGEPFTSYVGPDNKPVVIYTVFACVDGRYFCKNDAINTFNPDLYASEIRGQGAEYFLPFFSRRVFYVRKNGEERPTDPQFKFVGSKWKGMDYYNFYLSEPISGDDYVYGHMICDSQTRIVCEVVGNYIALNAYDQKRAEEVCEAVIQEYCGGYLPTH